MFNGTIHALENVETPEDIVSRINQICVILLIILFLSIIYQMNKCYKKRSINYSVSEIV